MMVKRLFAALCIAAVLASAFALAENDQSSVVSIACEPTDIIRAADGSFLVTDAYYKVVLQVKDGETVLYAGTPTRSGLYGEPVGGYRDSLNGSGTFRKPWAIVAFNSGYAVSDTNNNCVRYVTDTITLTIAGGEIEDPADTLQKTEWSRPTGLAADDNGDLYVSDTGNSRICRVDHETGEVTVVYSNLSEPTGLSWDDGCLYVAETGANRVLKLDVRSGELSVLAGNGEADYLDGEAAGAAFAWPLGVEVAEDGTVFIADSGNCAIRMLKDGVVSTLLMADLEALDQYPSNPQGMLYEDGILYVCDPYANKIYTVEAGIQ